MKQFKLAVVFAALVAASSVQANSFASLLDEAPGAVNPVRQILIGAGMACGSRLVSKAALSDKALDFTVQKAKNYNLAMGSLEGVAAGAYDLNQGNKASLVVTKTLFRAVGFGLGTAGLLALFPIAERAGLPLHG